MQRQGIRLCLKGGFAFIFLLALCGGNFLVSQRVHAAVQATYYVSPTGSDSNSGTDSSHPFATINHARQVVQTINSNMTGDIVVYLLEGTYHESLTFASNDSGTNGHNIIYQAYPGQMPLLSGGTRITGWTLHDSNKHIWQAPIPAGFNFRQLYINGARAHRAQGSALPSGTTINSTGYVIPNTSLANLLSPKDLEFVYNGTWVHSRCDVASISATSTQTTVTMNSPCFQIVTTWYWQALQYPSYLENAYEFLTSPGDWSIDTTHQLISYIPRAGENLVTDDVEVGNTQTLMTLNGTPNAAVQHLVFQGLTFAYTGWLQPGQGLGLPDAQANLMFPSLTGVQHWTNSQFVTPTGGSTWNGLPYGSMSVKMPGAVEAHAALNVQFLNNTLIHLGAAGLDMDGGSRNDTITGNVFADISGNGLQFGGVSTPNPASSAQRDGNTTITDNYLSDLDLEYQGGVGMFLGYVENMLVSHNELRNVPYSGISLGWGWGSLDTLPSYDTNNIISNNYIHDVMVVRQDGGCIYVLGPQPTGTVTSNFCSGSPWHGIYLDQGTTGEAVNNNVTEHIGSAWLAPNPNSFDSPGNTANGNYADTTGYGTRNVTVTNTTVFSDSSVPTAAQAIIANAGLEASYRTIVARTGPVYLADQANLNGGACLARDHPGYTASFSFIACMGSQGASATFTVNASAAGTYQIMQRYSNGTASTKTISVYVNGSKVQQASFPSTVDWNTWASLNLSLALQAGTNTITYKVDSGDTGVLNFDTLTLVTPTIQNVSGYAVNAGGAAVGSFAADAYSSGGSAYATTSSIDTSAVSNSAPQAVYQTERYGNFTYVFPNLKPGTQYTVRLHFAEIYWTSSGQRTFNVAINGQQVLSNFDIYATAGAANKAVVQPFTATADANGQIAIQFTSVKDNANVNGIEVLASSSATPTPTPTSTPTPTPTPTLTSTPTPTPSSTPTPTPTATSGLACSVQYVVTNQWQGGFGTSVTITNTGSTTINGWTLAWTFANGQTITQLWNGNVTQSGSSVSVTNLSYNSTLAPGGNTNFGFNGSWSGSNAIPTAFTLNGVPCTIF